MPRPHAYTARDGTVTWRVRIRAGGRATSETFTTEREAKAFCARVVQIGAAAAVAERARRDAHSDQYVPTLREHFAAHLTGLTGVDARTLHDYKRIAKRTFLHTMGDLPLDMIVRAQIADFIRHLEAEPARDRAGRPRKDADGRVRTLSAKSISNAHGLLSAVMKSAVIAGHIDRNPCLGVRLPRAGETERRDECFLTHEEYARLEAALPPQHVPLVRTLVGTGLRWSEATALQVRHVDLRQGTIRIVQAWKRRDGEGAGGRVLGPPKSPKSRRTVQVPAQVLEVLAPLVAGQPPDAYVFRNRAGNAIHHGYHRHTVWVTACKRAQLDPPPRIHDLRHTHASWLLEQPMVTLEMVQDQLGHESILTTRRVYGHLQPAMLARLRDAATAALALGGPAPAVVTGQVVSVVEGPPQDQREAYKPDDDAPGEVGRGQ